jgi:UDP-glucose 4-epimerase
MFKDKVVLLTGGTGSFGTTFVKRFLDSDVKKIIIFSRDEKKQDDMRIKYHHPKLKFIIGDIRDKDAVYDACVNVDYIFHAAALKQVPSCDFSPLEAVKTNILGTDNLIREAVKQKVKKIVFLSTGKAVMPINAMGISKAMMEKVIIENARRFKENDIDTTLTFIRYSNVFASRGSAINLFLEQIKNNEPITITHPKMYRSMMSVDEALDLALYAFENGNNGDLFIYKAKRTSLMDLARDMQDLLDAKNQEIKIIGKRHGEKLEETILSPDELLRVEDMGEYCRVPMDRRGLNYYVERTFDRRIQELNDEKVYELKVPDLTKDSLAKMLEEVGVEIKNKVEV